MTSNQLQYWANQEMIRANRARETENTRTNTTNEDIRKGTLDESVRHNVIGESIARGTLKEQSRHNKAGEVDTDLGRKQNWSFFRETKRHNRANERYAKETLPIQRAQAAASQMGAQASMYNVDVNRFNSQTNRLNAGTKEYEATTDRASKAGRLYLDASKSIDGIPIVGNIIGDLGAAGAIVRFESGVAGSKSNTTKKNTKSKFSKISNSKQTKSKSARTTKKYITGGKNR